MSALRAFTGAWYRVLFRRRQAMQAVLTHLRLLVAALSFSLLLLLCFGIFDSLVVAVVKPGGDSGGSDLTCDSIKGKSPVVGTGGLRCPTIHNPLQRQLNLGKTFEDSTS